MKAAVLREVRRIRIEETEKPRIENEDDVLVKVAYTGICGSDLHTYKGIHPFRKPPVILGHEVSGIVAETGPGVRNVAVGDPVTVMPYKACGTCVACRHGLTNVCRRKVVPGMAGWEGSFAEYFKAPESVTFRVPSADLLRKAVLAEPLAVGVHAAKVGGIGKGDRVLILGAGTIGLLTGLACRLRGAAGIAFTDIEPFNLDFARDFLGSDVSAFRADDPAAVETIRSRNPDGFDAVFLSSGARSNFDEGIALVRTGGTIVVTGMYMEKAEIEPLQISLRELKMVGSQIYVHEDFAEALRIIEGTEYDLGRIITGVYPLEDAQMVVEGIENRSRKVVKAVLSVG